MFSFCYRYLQFYVSVLEYYENTEWVWINPSDSYFSLSFHQGTWRCRKVSKGTTINYKSSERIYWLWQRSAPSLGTQRYWLLLLPVFKINGIDLVFWSSEFIECCELQILIDPCNDLDHGRSVIDLFENIPFLSYAHSKWVGWLVSAAQIKHPPHWKR